MEHYDVKGAVDKCLDLHKPDIKKLEEFELSTDLDNLPNDRSIKCYMYCLIMEFEMMKPDSPAIDVTKFVGIMNDMTALEQNIYLKMFRKCNKKYKDYCEMVYQMNVCAKRNDNEHYYLIFSYDWV